MNIQEAIKQLQTEHDLIANERDLDGSQFAPALLEALAMAIEVLECSEIPNSSDCISRQAAIDALWKALYKYEDKMEKQFQDSDELDAGDWFVHRTFVQNMSDIDRQTILELPSAQSEIVRCKDCVHFSFCQRYGCKEDDFCSFGERKDG